MCIIYRYFVQAANILNIVCIIYRYFVQAAKACNAIDLCIYFCKHKVNDPSATRQRARRLCEGGHWRRRGGLNCWVWTIDHFVTWIILKMLFFFSIAYQSRLKPPNIWDLLSKTPWSKYVLFSLNEDGNPRRNAGVNIPTICRIRVVVEWPYPINPL